MERFLSELKRRNVLRVAAFYAAAGWLLVQIATQVLPVFDAPTWAMRVVVVAVVLGFPFALVFSWFYELTPEGLKRENEIDRSQSISSQHRPQTRSLDHRRARRSRSRSCSPTSSFPTRIHRRWAKRSPCSRW